MPVPEILQKRIDMLRRHGRVFVKQDEFLTYNSWLSVMHGRGLRTKSLVPQIDRLGRGIMAYFGAFNGRVRSAVATMPPMINISARSPERRTSRRFGNAR
jgi:hypothetical protein